MVANRNPVSRRRRAGRTDWLSARRDAVLQTPAKDQEHRGGGERARAGERSSLRGRSAVSAVLLLRAFTGEIRTASRRASQGHPLLRHPSGDGTGGDGKRSMVAAPRPRDFAPDRLSQASYVFFAVLFLWTAPGGEIKKP